MGKSKYLLSLIFTIFTVLVLLTAGCSSSTSTQSSTNASNPVTNPTPTVEIVPTVSVEPGSSRKNPIPMNTLVSIPGWDIKVIQFLRGAEALSIINTPDWQAQPLPEGQEYALAKIYLKCTALDDNYHSLGISEMFITGSSNVGFGDTMDSWPQPEFLYEEMYTADEVEGWIDAVIPTAEKNLMVALNVTQDDVRTTRFFALQEGASIVLPAELAGLSPNELGVDYTNPAPAGQQVITPDWEITVLNSLSGQEAEVALGKDSGEYTPPPEGTEYLLLEVKLRYHNSLEVPMWMGGDRFYPIDTTDGSRLQVEQVYYYGQTDLVWLSKILLPGAETDVWVYMTIPSGTTQSVIAFDPDYSYSPEKGGNLRYLAVK